MIIINISDKKLPKDTVQGSIIGSPSAGAKMAAGVFP